MTLARQLVRSIRSLAIEPLPEMVAHAARLHFLDAIGVGLAAMGSPTGDPYRRFAERLPEGAVSILGMTRGAPAADAALVNGGLIHSLEYDDTHTASIIHGSAVLAATGLAAAEAAGSTGASLLGAYARGWEVLIRIGLAAPGAFQARGFQLTSVGGTLVAALVAADLLGLDEDRTVAALGIALSQASGVFEFLTNGGSVKSMHPGWAAHAGIIAAQLADGGLTGPQTALEGRFGLFRAFTVVESGQPAETFRELVGDLGRVWHLPDAAFKFVPCCHYLHPFVEAAGQLAERGVQAHSVRRILCRIAPGAAPIVCEPWTEKIAPESGHACRWSLPVIVAARLVEGQINLATFESPPPPAVLHLAARMSWEPLKKARFPAAFEAELVCETSDGTVHYARVDDACGNRSRPAGEDAVRAKFRANAARMLAEAATATLEAAVDDLGAASDCRILSVALRTGTARTRGSDV